MKHGKKTIVIGIGVLLVLVLAGAGWYLSMAVPIGTGYAARYICSSVFISHRDPQITYREDVAPVNPIAKIIDVKIDQAQKKVVASSFGLFKSTALYREGCGCTLVTGTTEAELRKQGLLSLETAAPRDPTAPWPIGDGGASELVPGELNIEKLKAALDAAFVETDPEKKKMTRAVVTKSKFSELKTLAQWEGRDARPQPVLDALTTRQKLSAEVARVRAVLTRVVASGPEFGHVVALGDFNDGPFADVMEAEFLMGNILDELVGTMLEPNTFFKHAMEPERLAGAATTRFRDPLRGGAVVEELIDQVIVSPGIWSGLGQFRIRPGSCVVEADAWLANADPADSDSRQGRPSDHKPVSVVIEWDD